jgi:hypothetical protein
VHAKHRQLLAEGDEREKAASEVEGRADIGDVEVDSDATRDDEQSDDPRVDAP